MSAGRSAVEATSRIEGPEDSCLSKSLKRGTEAPDTGLVVELSGMAISLYVLLAIGCTADWANRKVEGGGEGLVVFI